MVVIVPILVYILVNTIIFNYIRCSCRRVHIEFTSSQTSLNFISQIRITRHDIHLFRYIVCTFCLFIIGWCPIFVLISINFESQLSPSVYISLAVLAEASFSCIIINLFRYNKKLRHYLTKMIFRCV